MALRNGLEPVERLFRIFFSISILWTYILRLKSGHLYIGATNDLKQRYQDHLNGRACRTTKLDPPVKVV